MEFGARGRHTPSAPSRVEEEEKRLVPDPVTIVPLSLEGRNVWAVTQRHKHVETFHVQVSNQCLLSWFNP